MRRICLLVACLILPWPTPALAGKNGPLDVKAAIVADFASGRVLFEQNPDRQIPPASVTKIMTMYLVYESLSQGRVRLSDPVRVSRGAADTGGSSMNLAAGETVTLGELMAGMAVASGNDACVAVAEHFGGQERFVAAMNAKARQLGMTGTTFVNPNGLPAPGQLTTARDMLKLADAYLKRFPQSLSYHSTIEIRHNGTTRHNSNRLLGDMEGVDGIKTGWVAASGYNIVATCKRDGRRVIAVVLGGRSWQIRNRETKKIIEASLSPRGVSSILADGARDTAPKAPVVAEAGPSKKAGPKRAGVEKRERETRKELAAKAAPTKTAAKVHDSTWTSRKDAQARAKALRQKGLPAHVVSQTRTKGGELHQVIIGETRSLAPARSS